MEDEYKPIFIEGSGLIEYRKKFTIFYEFQCTFSEILLHKLSHSFSLSNWVKLLRDRKYLFALRVDPKTSNYHFQKSAPRFYLYLMMKNIQIFVLLFGLIALTTCTGLWLNSQSTEFYRKSDDWSTFKINAAGGSGVYDYRYYDLPSRWDYRNDDIYIPRNFRSGRYQVRVQVYDVLWRKDYSCYAVIELREDDYDNYRVYIRDEFDHSYNIKQNYEYQERKNYVYPTWEKIEMLIQQGDIDEIEGIIMKVIDSDNDCDDKKQFLTAVLNRIQRFLDVHQDSIDKLQAENQQLAVQIQYLNKQIISLKKQISDNIAKLNSDLRTVESKIYWYQKKIADDQKDINQYEASQKQFHDRVWAIKDIDIPKIESEIASLRSKLKSVKNEYCGCSYYSKYYYSYDRNRIEDEINRKEKAIRALERDANELEQKEAWFTKKIEEIRGRQDDNKRTLSELENQKAAIEREIKNAQYDRTIVIRIEQLERQIKVNQSQIEKNRWEIKVGEQASKTLKEALEHFREVADKSYYECQDYKIIEVRVTTYVEVVVTPVVFRSYVQNGYGYDIYGSSFGNIRSDRYRNADRVSVARSNVFSNSWVSNYGRAYSPYEYRYGSRLFAEDYQCRSSGSSRNGRVTRVEGRRIYVESDYQEHSLELGDCSSVDVSTGYGIPKPNDYIVWKGESYGSNSHRVHSALCF